MRHIYLIAFLLVSFYSSAQIQFKSRSEAVAAIDTGYVVNSSGWKIRAGDTLSLGKGTLVGGGYTHIYSSMSSAQKKEYLRLGFGPGRKLPVRRLAPIGNKTTGFTIIAVVGAGLVFNYYVELVNAIESGEIVPPEKYRIVPAPTAAAQVVAPVSVADEIRKLKGLLDEGLISKEEYEAQRKKLLGQ